MCSGIGAPEQAMPFVQWCWSAEIEQFPAAVLSQRHGTPNLGDITAPDFIDRAMQFGPLDLLVAGTPCQAFSVAGRRESLSDARGNLTLRFVEIVDAIQPRFVLWENVVGVLGTDDNAFGCFLGALVGADSPLIPATGQRWTDAGVADGPARMVAWRVLDAEYFGVAQRRERVFVIAGARDERPGEILFERDGVQRYSAPVRERVSPCLDTGITSFDRASKDMLIIDGGRVRVLTPIEAERLQGFPDGYSDIGDSDRKRYKALGNTMCVPVLSWIGRRIMAAAA